MAAESDLYTALTGASGVTDIVGAKVFSDIPDEGAAPPFVFFERIDTDMINTIHGGLPMAEITQLSVVCYAETREVAESLGDACAAAAVNATNAQFTYVGRLGEYDDDIKLFAAAIDLRHYQ